jgi:hypothetical protein
MLLFLLIIEAVKNYGLEHYLNDMLHSHNLICNSYFYIWKPREKYSTGILSHNWFAQVLAHQHKSHHTQCVYMTNNK